MIRWVTTALLLLALCLASAAPAAVEVQWFYVDGCYRCREVKEAIAAVEYNYSNEVAVARYEITDPDNYRRLMDMEQRHGVAKGAAMEAFVGDVCLLGHSEILDKLGQTVEEAIRGVRGRRSGRWAGAAASKEKEEGYAVAAVSDRRGDLFSHMGPLAVAGVGLVDGINPCAFATIVFLVSILASRHFTRKEIVGAGLAFSGAVFVTYFLIGLGAFRMLQKLEVFHKAAAGLYWFIAAGVFVLGLVSLKDAFAYRRTQSAGGMALKMPDATRDAVHGILRRTLRPGFVLVTCFVAGCLVSVLELVCTGQIYLPTIMVMVKTPSVRASGLGYLLLYNLMFVMPLLAVMALFVLGLKWQALARFSSRSVFLTKILLALVFFALAAILVASRRHALY